jgi:N-acetylglutamate synthase-like GNAT family acetyltransferase
MRIRNATNADLSAVESLLSASDLPLDGVRDNFSSFIVAEDEGKIAGAIGLEEFGSSPDTAVVMTRRFGTAPRATA